MLGEGVRFPCPGFLHAKHAADHIPSRQAWNHVVRVSPNEL